MPIIDDLTEAIRSGRVNPSDHIIVLHPQDFNELLSMMVQGLPTRSFHDAGSNPPTIMGFQVHVDQHVPQGRFIMYPVPSPLFMSDQMMMPSLREAITSFRPRPQPQPKTLWEHLEDDEDE